MENIEAVVFDMDGVLRIGNKIINNAQEVLETLIENNIKTMIVTNECRYTVNELKEDLNELGLTIPEECHFYTAGLSARDYLEKKLLRFPNKNFTICVVGELGLYSTIRELNMYANFNLEDNPKNIKKNDKVFLILGTVNRIKINHLNKILDWVKAGAKVITTCVDTTDPSSKGDFNLGMPSHTLHMVGYNIKTKSYSTGKPHPIHKEKIMKTLRIENPENVLFVGDTMYSDIQLAEESNFKSCLVLSGNSKKETIDQYVTEPDYIVNNVNDILKLLRLK